MSMVDERAPDHDESLEELAAGYAVGALDRDDAERFRSHVAVCATCRRLAREYGAVALLMPESLEEMDASAGLRARVLESARASTPGTAQATHQPTEQSAPTATILDRGRAPRRRTIASWSLPLAALVTVVLGLGYWNFRLNQRVAEQAALIELQHEALVAVAAGGRQLALTGTADAPAAGGVLIVDPSATNALLIVRGLPELPKDRDYQAWVIAGGRPADAGLLAPDGRGGQVGRLNRSLEAADTVAVTVEPAGGASSPTGPIVVSGKL